MPCISTVSKLKWRELFGKSERLSNKSILNFTDSMKSPSTWKIVRSHAVVRRFFQGILFHTQMKDEANTSSKWCPKETVTAIIKPYKNTKAVVHSADGDTNFFNFVAAVLQGNTLAPYLFIISLDKELRTLIDLMKENGFTF